MMLLNGVSCNRYKAAVLKAADLIMQSHSKVTKGDTRQDNDYIKNEIDFAGFSEQCKLKFLALQRLDLDFDNAPQTSFNTLFGVLCNPECGQPIFDIYRIA